VSNKSRQFNPITAKDSVYFAMTDRFCTAGPAHPDVNQDNPQGYHGGNFAGLISKISYLKNPPREGLGEADWIFGLPDLNHNDPDVSLVGEVLDYDVDETLIEQIEKERAPITIKDGNFQLQLSGETSAIYKLP
jgi:hypothetical protein